MVSYYSHSYTGAAEPLRIAQTNSLDNNTFSLLFAVFSLNMPFSFLPKTDALLEHQSLEVNIQNNRLGESVRSGGVSVPFVTSQRDNFYAMCESMRPSKK